MKGSGLQDSEDTHYRIHKLGRTVEPDLHDNAANIVLCGVLFAVY